MTMTTTRKFPPQEPAALKYGSADALDEIGRRIKVLEKKCVRQLESQGFSAGQIATESFLHMRYEERRLFNTG